MNDIIKTGKLGPLKTGFAARVDSAKKQGTLATELFDCTKYPNRIVLCIDDSGSMSSVMSDCPACGGSKQYIGSFGESLEECSHCKDKSKESRMTMCRKACEEFLNVCDSRDTALGMYTISTGREYPLTNLYIPLLGYIRELQASGGTPTIATLDKVISKEKVSRVVLVSDGESGALDWYSTGREGSSFTSTARVVLDKYKERKIPIDTVFIGSQGDESSSGYKEMSLIADYTDGLFMFFKSGESFRSKFKYLAPAFRGMLVAGEIKL